MPVPDFQSLMLPVLKSLPVRSNAILSEIRASVAQDLGLTDEDLREVTPGAGVSRFADRVS